MGAIVLDGAQIGDDCMIGAGSLVTKNAVIPSGSLVYGSPAKVVRALNPQELAFLSKSAENYVGDSTDYHGIIPGPVRSGAHNVDLEIFGHGFVSGFDDPFDGHDR
jgi:hypothetical protein